MTAGAYALASATATLERPERKGMEGKGREGKGRENFRTRVAGSHHDVTQVTREQATAASGGDTRPDPCVGMMRRSAPEGVQP